MQLDAVEAGCQRAAGGMCILGHDGAHFSAVQGVRRDEIGGAAGRVALAGRLDGRRRYRRGLLGQHRWMGDAAAVHQLHEDPCAFRVDRVRDLLPRRHLRVADDAWRTHIALAHGAGEHAFGNDQAGAGALAVVGDGHVGQHAAGFVGARTRHRCHDDAVAQGVGAEAQGMEESAHDVPYQGGSGSIMHCSSGEINRLK